MNKRSTETVKRAMQEAIRIAGTQAVLGDWLGVTQGQIGHWACCRKPIPAARAVAIERATGGLVSRKQLRPDDWRELWPELEAA